MTDTRPDHFYLKPYCTAFLESSTQSMQNLESSIQKILQMPPRHFEISYNRRDLILYALGIGETDRQFTHESDPFFAAFPLCTSVKYECFLIKHVFHVDPVMFPFLENAHDISFFPPKSLCLDEGTFPPIKSVIHVEQTLEIHHLIANQSATYHCESRILSIRGEVKGAFMERETLIRDQNGILHARLLSGLYIPGLCGICKNEIASLRSRIVMPRDQKPDWEFSLKTTPEQAMLYRLSGYVSLLTDCRIRKLIYGLFTSDYNPLHIDPDIAISYGFESPVLHGLCTMGITARVLYKIFCCRVPSRFKKIRVRFRKPVYPGDSLKIQIWRHSSENDQQIVVFRTIVPERDCVVLDGGEFTYLPGQRARL